MKYLYSVLAFLLQCLNVEVFWTADQFAMMIFLYCSLLIVGIMLSADKGKDKSVIDLGLGIIFGSVGVVVAMIGLFVYLSFNFPR